MTTATADEAIEVPERPACQKRVAPEFAPPPSRKQIGPQSAVRFNLLLALRSLRRFRRTSDPSEIWRASFCWRDALGDAERDDEYRMALRVYVRINNRMEAMRKERRHEPSC